MSREDVLAAEKNRKIVSARSLLCYWAAGELRISMTALSVRLSISVDAVSKSVARGKLISKLHNYSLY